MTDPNGMLELQVFAFGKDFDYLKYLEHQSHFDCIKYKMDEGIRKLVTSNENTGQLIRNDLQELNSILNEGFEAVVNVMTDGFKRVESQLVDVNLNLENIHYAIEDGFQKTALVLTGIESSLDELLQLAKTPEQTWAYEQYSIAQDLFQKGFFDDAILNIDRAINGYGNNTGYRYDHRLHMLKGLINLGSEKNTDAEIVNLELAQKSFRNAAKYAVLTSLQKNRRFYSGQR
jgi:tetratricopeptide (TPR) repeat protein